MKTFREFADRETREAQKQLGIVKRLLESQGFKVADHRNDYNDPYIFVKATGDVSFQGIRIYKIGDTIAFRVQREEETHPYGKAYMLNIEDMFNDFMSDEGVKKLDAGKKVIKVVAEEVKDFFKKSGEAEDELKSITFNKQGDPLNRVIMNVNGNDYANTLMTRGTNYT